MLELERIFLVSRLPENLAACDYLKINQKYLRSGNRLRKRQDFVNTGHGQHELKETRYELTQKRSLTPGDKTRREETTVELSEEEYEALRPKAIRSLKKNRHLIPLERGLTAELDVFQDGLKGLVWVEVEFPTEESMAAFEPPDWFGREVSNEKWASSSWVAGRTFEEIKQFVV